jgi:hypothetical protein
MTLIQSGPSMRRHVELPPAGPSYVRQEALPGEHLANLAPLYVSRAAPLQSELPKGDI